MSADPSPVDLPVETTVGWVGCGVMGASMCGHVIDAGYEVTVTTRTRSRSDALVERGATWADTPAAVAANSDVVFLVVGYPADVRSVVQGDDGILSTLRPGRVVVDCTTSEPALAEEIAEAAAVQGVHALDAPVSGGDVGARNGTLSVMVGGEGEALARVRPILETFGSTIVHQGPAGAGQHTKMVNQTLIASTMVGVCEALVYAHRAGLDLDTVLASVAGGAAGSWSLSNLTPRMLAGDAAPGFFVDHFVKDLGIALSEASRLRLSLPGLALAHQLYVSMQAHGRGADGTQALIATIAELSAIDWNNR